MAIYRKGQSHHLLEARKVPSPAKLHVVGVWAPIEEDMRQEQR